MPDFNKIEKKMEEDRHNEGTKVEESNLVIPLLPRKPYIWLMITDGKNDRERHIFYSIIEDRYYVRFVPELQSKYVACCYGGWLVLRDNFTDDCSILNILTLEKLQLPPLHSNNKISFECVISSPNIDRSCRVIFFQRGTHTFKFCHLGDTELIERKWIYENGWIRNLINFKGKLYALTSPDYNLVASDFSDPDLHLEQAVSGKSLADFNFPGPGGNFYLVESWDDLLLIFIYSYDYEVSDVKIFKANFSSKEWVRLETLGDRTIFFCSSNDTFSSPATTVGMKGNAVYWVVAPFLYMYDIEDKSISMSIPFPSVGPYSWVSFPIMTCNEKKMPKQKDRGTLFEASPVETSFHVQRGKATTESTELQVERRKPQRRKEIKTIGSTIVRKEKLWADLPNDLLLEIFSHLFAGDSVAFRSVCSSWYEISPSKKTQQFVLPLKSSDCSSPLLMFPDYKTYHPIYGELYSIDFPDIPGATVRATQDGWLLMDYYSTGLFFYNPFTKAEKILPDFDAWYYYSVYFSAPPTSADCLVVAAAVRSGPTCPIYSICYMTCKDEGWTCRDIEDSFRFDFCNAIVHKGLYYFLGHDAKLLIFNPEEDEVRVIEAPIFPCAKRGERYMLESDGKLIAVFVGWDGSSVYPCEWNVSMSKWEILDSLGNIMVFVSRPLSLCKKATVSGTGNKIYFPRVVGDGHILFYSLATKRYHTFEMGSSYHNFFASKYYPHLYKGWFMP